MSTEISSIAARLAQVEERIHLALQSCGRRRDEINLIAVSKLFPAEAVLEAYGAGLREFGENYVQEFSEKLPLISPLPDARFHLIGHLQSNKARPATELFQVIQTVDSAKLARRLNEAGVALEVMIEVKLSEEQAKAGAPPEALPELVETIRGFPNLKLTGLMTMPPWSEDAEKARPYFRRLRELAGRFSLERLSMGMSIDFPVAIQEGATDIRVGTSIFGRRVHR